MGRLIDIDKVLELDCLSKKARKEIEKLPAMSTISHRAHWVDSEDSRENREKHNLACVLLCAYRYAVNRHGTRCLDSCNLGDIVIGNLDLMCDDFIRQMIEGIFEQKCWCSRDREHRYPVMHIDYLMGDFSQTVKWLLKQSKISECEKLTEIVRKVNQASRDIQGLEKSLRMEIEKVYWDDDTSYLDPFLEALQQEYEKRGYSRIEEEIIQPVCKPKPVSRRVLVFCGQVIII